MALDSSSSLVAGLTQAALVRVDRVEDRLEPWLAERWSRSPDGLSYELSLRPDVRFSDGEPLDAADVEFSFAAAYDEAVGSPLGDVLRVGGEPLDVEVVDASTVRVTYPEPFSPGLRMLSNLPILPEHRLRSSLDDGTLSAAWDLATPPETVVGLGPFVLSSYDPGQRLTFDRNPNYWRMAADGSRLPRLDRLTLEIVPEQNAETLRFEAGTIDFTQDAVRAEDYPAFRRAEKEGRVRLYDLGVALDADFLFFNLRPDALAGDPRQPWLQADDLRRAIAHAVDRQMFADTVYLGLGEPVHGPVNAANRRWHHADVTTYDHDLTLAADRLAAIGLVDRDGDGDVEDAEGRPARFTLLTQQGHTVRERAAAVIAADLKRIGLTVDVVPLEFGSLVERITAMQFDAVYLGVETSDPDPATNLDLWLSSSAFHFWNPSQTSPATDWEARIDDLMRRQASASDEGERTRLFDEVQEIFAQHVPALYFAAPRLVIATSPRVARMDLAPLKPHVLWSADTLAVEPEWSPMAR